jgi:hypothetical protein
MEGGRHILTYRESRLIREELLQPVFSQQSDVKLHKDSSLLRTVVIE